MVHEKAKKIRKLVGHITLNGKRVGVYKLEGAEKYYRRDIVRRGGKIVGGKWDLFLRKPKYTPKARSAKSVAAKRAAGMKKMRAVAGMKKVARKTRVKKEGEAKKRSKLPKIGYVKDGEGKTHVVYRGKDGKLFYRKRGDDRKVRRVALGADQKKSVMKSRPGKDTKRAAALRETRRKQEEYGTWIQGREMATVKAGGVSVVRHHDKERKKLAKMLVKAIRIRTKASKAKNAMKLKDIKAPGSLLQIVAPYKKSKSGKKRVAGTARKAIHKSIKRSVWRKKSYNPIRDVKRVSAMHKRPKRGEFAGMRVMDSGNDSIPTSLFLVDKKGKVRKAVVGAI